MKINIAFRYILLVLVVITLPAGCAPPDDISILKGTEICKPPCWMDIQPGNTNGEQAISLLSEKEHRGSGRLTLLESGIIRWQSTGDYNSYIYASESGLVEKIEIDLRSDSIHLDDVITIFGEPSKLDIGKISDGYFFATIFYPERGLAFVVGGNKFDLNSSTLSFALQSDIQTVKGLFFQPLDIPAMVNLLYGTNSVPEALSDIQDWNGYGVYYE